jgi:hypothetical protein
MKSCLFLVIFLTTSLLWAQISVGLRESALGNSGVAISESTAPSFYNPALLSERKQSYYSLTGNTLTSYQSSDHAGSFSSTKLAPNYLSSIHSFETFIHEFSLANRVSIDSRSTLSVGSGTNTIYLKADQYVLSYAMAFRKFPIGFQVGLRMNEQNYQINQIAEDASSATGVNINMSRRIADLFAAFGGIHQLGNNYRFGYKYESRGKNIYNKLESDGFYYSYDKIGNNFSSGKTNGPIAVGSSTTGQSIAVGHSFTWNDHEFLTDSRFLEDVTLNNKYSFSQSFGYKVNYTNKIQFMCGMAHRFKSELSSLAESNYYSSGFSWLTNTMRSSISAYYSQEQNETDTQSAGITFGSEFSY